MEADIPTTKKWRAKVSCNCPMEKRIPPNELFFLLDQRSSRLSSIRGLDVNVATRNRQIISGRRNPAPRTSLQSELYTVTDETIDEPSDIDDDLNDPDFAVYPKAAPRNLIKSTPGPS